MFIRLISLIIIFTSLAACSSAPTKQAQHLAALDTYYDYIIYDPTNQQTIDNTDQLAHLLTNSSVVLFGEFHSQPAIHLAQLRLFQSLYAQQHDLSLSMEQFDRSQQAIVNRYLANEIGEAWLIKQTNAWPNYPSDYRPLVEFAKQHELRVVAANAPKKLVSCIGQQGQTYIDTLPTAERAMLAETFTRDDPDYKERLFGNGHHGDQAQADNHFLAMLAWDETMAESVVTELAHGASKQVMHIAGNFHVDMQQGTYSRIKQRLNNQTISSIVAIDQAEFAQLDEQQKALKGDYLIVVKQLPIRYQQQEHQMAEYSAINKNKINSCKK
ncbi:ChaN family lipoprotein [Agarivorans sp. MS3-6]|uniref:ChaN family lipoprotein n=1 Tax=Agarivorans sp. TSD2052 TaxID=2937286 RepID=UPI00200BDFAE|nr:ChaN family lipoprotein [Agarivorans sp. TSD2052]UPW17574.1 ChaN family lipoprotein [Agarivorans sp. TSD2052]